MVTSKEKIKFYLGNIIELVSDAYDGKNTFEKEIELHIIDELSREIEEELKCMKKKN